MAKKEWREVPESELTEEEVRRGFNRLRELFKESQYRVHEMKVEKGKMNVKICHLEHEIRTLKKENKRLRDGIGLGIGEKKSPQKTKSKVEVVEFKKKFFDSL